MPRANPKAWFPTYTALISYKKVDKWADRQAHLRPYFSTWKEAHDWMLEKAANRLKKAKAELKSATGHHLKISTMKEPK